MRNAYRLRWKNPVDGLAGVHAIGYASDDEAFAAAVSESYKLGWDGLTRVEHGPDVRYPSEGQNFSEWLAFWTIIAGISVLLAFANGIGAH